jgi:hypothetical protein
MYFQEFILLFAQRSKREFWALGLYLFFESFFAFSCGDIWDFRLGWGRGCFRIPGVEPIRRLRANL